MCADGAFGPRPPFRWVYPPTGVCGQSAAFRPSVNPKNIYASTTWRALTNWWSSTRVMCLLLQGTDRWQSASLFDPTDAGAGGFYSLSAYLLDSWLACAFIVCPFVQLGLACYSRQSALGCCSLVFAKFNKCVCLLPAVAHNRRVQHLDQQRRLRRFCRLQLPPCPSSHQGQQGQDEA